MKAVATTLMSEEAYIRYELHAERRHEYLNGQLFEMPGEQAINNRIAFYLALQLFRLEAEGYFIYNHDVKVAIPGGQKYYYPDVFLTAEAETEDTRYIKREPVLIAEVVSESSHKTDYVDKYIDYTRIPSLQYYLIIEPETPLITLCQRSGADEWTSHKYSAPTAQISLPALALTIPLTAVYGGTR